MALQAELEKLDGMSGDVAQHYTQGEDGKFRLTVEGFDLSDMAGLKSALAKERTRASKLEDSFKRFDGIDADAARDALQKLERYGDVTPETLKDQIDNAVTKTEAQYKGLLQQEQDRNGNLTKQIDQYMLNDAIGTAAKKHGGNDVLIRPILKEFVNVETNKNGTRSVQIVDEQGNVRLSNTGENMTIDEFVGKMKTDPLYMQLFNYSGANGGGANGGSGQPGGGASGKKMKLSEFNEMSANDRSAFMAAGGILTD